ncbi:flagellar motor protein MotB [Psychromonas sp. 14N.309.X.WAT.B.A12]|jgi:chemotaxis protein MotB|uniref:flagellar motor protein MotB n=1 Tax=unclassified Psychromonas TaxID=2614957 RepID=UPI0025B1FAB5|nr:flagellar motor protein MotB [Psychromonas sp. 14N.309.X.WAT.B.A12]MDN2662857.1 OmpA family protein [Psychromonas sp. 14N.309.X.WAT.B.A12]
MPIYHRRNAHKAHSNHVHRWTVSYADYMTLMFALFVVLYAVSSNNEEKYQEVIEIIQQASKFVEAPHSGSNANGILTKRSNDIKENTGPALLSDGEDFALGHVSELESEQLSSPAQTYTGKSLQALQLSLESALKTELESGAFSVDLNGDWLTIEMSGPLLFANASHTLLNGAKRNIKQIANVLSPVNNMLRLRGYTDPDNISNEIYASNWELSAMRAISVLKALSEQGVGQHRMVIEAYGKFQPVINENGVEDKLKSRRVVIAISKYAVFEKEVVENKSKNNEVVEPEVPRVVTPDSDEIREIYRPDGRLIITTRQE